MKPSEAFSPSQTTFDNLKRVCKICVNKYNKKRNRENPVGKKLETMLAKAKIRSRLTGRSFNLTISHLRTLVVEHCPVLGQPLLWNYSNDCGPKPFSPSLDRIDNSKGYVAGNVAIISFRANAIKNSASLEEVKSLYEYMLNGCQNSTPDMVSEQ
jgi:hypothetical protein